MEPFLLCTTMILKVYDIGYIHPYVQYVFIAYPIFHSVPHRITTRWLVDQELAIYTDTVVQSKNAKVHFERYFRDHEPSRVLLDTYDIPSICTKYILYVRMNISYGVCKST